MSYIRENHVPSLHHRLGTLEKLYQQTLWSRFQIHIYSIIKDTTILITCKSL